jgi:hypothetical protein
MAEMSYTLVEPVFNQTLASPIGPGNVTITLNPTSPVPATTYLYIGALVVVGWHAVDAEVVAVTGVTGPNTFTGVLVNAHAQGETVFGATFPTQEATDQIFTQAEIQGYISQAQNEFLTKVPLIFELFLNQTVFNGQVYQTLPDTAIELERVSLQSTPASYNIATISRTGTLVTAVLSQAVPVTPAANQWTQGLGILVLGVSDNTYNSVNNVVFPLTFISADGLTLMWRQAGFDSSSVGGAVMVPVLTRLYESSQNQIAMQNPAWQSSTGIPTNWFEDRAGAYGWGVAPVPSTNFYVELLTSIRGPVFMNQLDFFLVPDIFVPYIKYEALAFAASKDGVQRSPSMSRFFQSRFDFGVMLADRFLRAVIEKTGGQQ